MCRSGSLRNTSCDGMDPEQLLGRCDVTNRVLVIDTMLIAPKELRNGNLAPLPLRPEASGKLSLRMTVKEHKRTLPKGTVGEIDE